MLYLLLAFSFALSIGSYYTHNKAVAPGVLFNIVWTMVYLLLIININSFYDVSDTVVAIMFAGQLFFNLGSQTKLRFSKTTSVHFVDSGSDFAISSQMVLVQIVVLLAILPFAYKALNSINLYGFAMQRYYFATNTDHLFTTFERYFYIYQFSGRFSLRRIWYL